MTTDYMTKILFASGGTVFAVLLGSVAYFLRGLIAEVRAVRQEITDIRIELAKDYVQRDEMSKNDQAHKDLREDLTALRDRVTTIEAAHNAKACKG